MDDKRIIDLMLKGDIPEVTSKVRKPGSRVVCDGIIDDFLDPNGQNNVLYLKWIHLVAHHVDGTLELKGMFKTASGFVRCMSQYNPKYMITNQLKIMGTTEFSEKTVSVLPVKVYKAMVYSPLTRFPREDATLSKEMKEIVMEYILFDALWELSVEERDNLRTWAELVHLDTPEMGID